MKKILLTTLCFAAIQLYAQTPKWVSTTVQKKNAILEEFTGIHCGYCPDGHKIANDLVNANPGKVFLINIHSGGFATPSAAGDIDLRTTAGTAIDAASGVTGYPAGSVNRSTAPWSGGRNLWTGQVSGIIAQNSPVNVYVKATIDFATRTLTTEVEVYYTGTSANSRNYLTVALTQDGILGSQSDYGNYNPTNWVGTQYLHNHVLRQLISSGTSATVGEAIDSANITGHYFYKKYTTVIPATYPTTSPYLDGGINLTKLGVVAYVSEGSTGGTILSGFGSPVELPAGIKADLSLTDITVKPTSYCFATINPKATVTNVFDSTVTAFDVSAFINGVETVKHYAGSLAKNASTTIDWGSVPVTNTGTFTLSLKGFSNVVGLNSVAKVDVNNLNDVSPLFSTLGFKSAAFVSTRESFEAGMPANMAFETSQNKNIQILTGSTVNYGLSSKSAVVWKLHSSWGVSGKPASIILGEVDFSANAAPGMSFYYACNFSDEAAGTAPSLAVSASTDCGTTWTPVTSFTCVQTGVPTTTGNFYDPKAWEYKFVSNNLSAYKNSKVLLKITGTPGAGGNALYVDDINVNSFAKLAVTEVSNANNQFEIFPNPASNNFTVKLTDAKNATIRVFDLTGKEVINTVSNGLESVIDCNQLNNGLYLVEVTADGSTSRQKVLIAK